MVELRYYQRDALHAIVSAESHGVTRQLIVSPTGSGKSSIIASLPIYRPNSFPILVLVHREELVDQLAGAFPKFTGITEVSIEQGPRHAEHTPVVIASVQSMTRRLNRFDPHAFRVVILDEAHRAAAPTFAKCLDYFQSELRLGFTATPQRGDNVGLSHMFDEVTYFKSIQELIFEGYLSDIVGYRYNTDIDLSSVRIVRGEYAEAELAAAVNVDARNELIVQAYKEYTPGRKAIVFCVNIGHARAVAAHFRKLGIDAYAVDSKTSRENRKDLLEAFDANRFRVLCGVNIFIEGYDQPDVDAILWARPTRSQLFYTQGTGRGLRLFKDKTNCIVIDIADVTKGKIPVGLPSLLGLPYDFDLAGGTLSEAAKKFQKLEAKSPESVLHVKSLADIDAAWEQINIFTPTPLPPEIAAITTMTWIPTSADSFWLKFGDERISISADTLSHWHVKFTSPNIVGADLQTATMQAAFSYAESWIRQHRPEALRLVDAASVWRGDPPTDKQLKWLRRYKVPITADLTKGEASKILDALFATKPKKSVPAWVKIRPKDIKF